MHQDLQNRKEEHTDKTDRDKQKKKKRIPAKKRQIKNLQGKVERKQRGKKEENALEAAVPDTAESRYRNKDRQQHKRCSLLETR